jgi:cell division control protein 6
VIEYVYRALLRATSNRSFQISDREKERTQIHDFVTSFDAKDVPTTLYISGLPGSGKTALVNSVLDKLDSSKLKVISINCMTLNSIDALWERLLEELDEKKKSKTKQVSSQEVVECVLSTIKTKW